MGGGGYSRDVSSTRSTRQEFTFSQDIARDNGAAVLREKKIDGSFDPRKAMKNGWECRESPEHPAVMPIALVIDLTKSRGEDILIAYDKAPLLVGQILMKNYADHPEVSIGGVGDVRYDRFPVQISDFESDQRVDKNMKALIIEEGGGGNGFESYATIIYGYAYHSYLDANTHGKKGFMFVLGDERFYPIVTKEEIKRVYGIEEKKDLPAEKIFQEAQKKYHVFFIYVKKSSEERKKGIDAEIKKRVQERGGMYQGVSIRASLIWDTCDDLDLHVIPPSGEEIYFSHMRSACGGELDVDTNAGGCKTRKAVENIRWKKGKAPKGRYQVFVRNYAYHDPDTKSGPVPFKAELEVDGEISYFEGQTPAHRTGRPSDIICFEFEYDPAERKRRDETPEDPYAAYADDLILDQWRTVLPEENILVIKEPKAIGDVMLGAIAGVEKRRTLDEYDHDLKEREQSPKRREEVKTTLSPLYASFSATGKVTATKLPKKPKR